MILVVVLAVTAVSAAQVAEYQVLPRTREVTVDCPKQQTTRVVLPERVTGYRGDPAAEADLGFHIETRPRAVISVHPTRHPFQARFRIDGVTLQLVLIFRTVAAGGPREIRLRLAGSSPAHERAGAARPALASLAQGGEQVRAASPEPQTATVGLGPTIPSPPSVPGTDNVSEPPAPTVSSTADADGTTRASEAEPTVEAKASVEDARAPIQAELRVPAQQIGEPRRPNGLLDPGILTARVRSIGRVESLPGQRPVELVDLLEGSRHVWLRFSIRDAKGARVERIWWEHGPITAYAVEEIDDGKRLALVVQLPRRSETGTALITRRTRVHIKLADGERKFSLSAPWLGAFLKDLLGW